MNGERNGNGKEYYKNGKLKYVGEFLNGKYNGKGKEYFLNGKVKFNGEFLNGDKIKNKKWLNDWIIIFNKTLFINKLNNLWPYFSEFRVPLYEPGII